MLQQIMGKCYLSGRLSRKDTQFCVEEKSDEFTENRITLSLWSEVAVYTHGGFEAY